MSYPRHLLDSRRASLPTLDSPPADRENSWTSFPDSGSSPANSSRRPSADVTEALYSFSLNQTPPSQSRKRSWDISAAAEGHAAHPSPFGDDHWAPPPPVKQGSSLRPPSSRQAAAARLGPRSASRQGRGSPSGSSSNSSHSQRIHPASARLQASASSDALNAFGSSFDGYSFPARTASQPALLAAQQPTGVVSPLHLDSRGQIVAAPRSGPLARGRRPEVPGEHKYPHALSRERLRQQRSFENLRRLPSAGIRSPASASSSTSSPISPPLLTAVPSLPNLPPGRWSVPKQAPPPPAPQDIRNRKDRKQAELEAEVRRRILNQSFSGRRKLEMERPEGQIADPLESLLGAADPMENKATRGGYSGLGIEKGQGWRNVAEFRNLLDESRASGDGTRNRANSVYLAEPDSPPLGSTGFRPSQPHRQHSTPPSSHTSSSASVERPNLPPKSATVPFSASTTSRSGGFFSRRGSGVFATSPLPIPTSHRPPPLDLSFSPHSVPTGEPTPALRPRPLKDPKTRAGTQDDYDEAVMTAGYHPPHPLRAQMEARASAEGQQGKRRMTIKNVMKGFRAI